MRNSRQDKTRVLLFYKKAWSVCPGVTGISLNSLGPLESPSPAHLRQVISDSAGCMVLMGAQKTMTQFFLTLAQNYF